MGPICCLLTTYNAPRCTRRICFTLAFELMHCASLSISVNGEWFNHDKMFQLILFETKLMSLFAFLCSSDRIVLVSVIILVFLFLVQRFGTDKVGYSFAPIITAWFLCIAGIGVFNFVKYDPWVVKAINPKYIIDYFQRNGKTAWISLGGVVLCITGVEALFADVGHFTVRSVQISMCSVAFPSLVLAYTGQASYLRKHMEDVSDTFYKSIPGGLYWPMFVVAILAAIIASQAMISGTFSIIQQSLSLGCFPRVKVVHTSAKHEGQVYIPEMNYILMIACVAVTVAFKTTEKIGNAYGSSSSSSK